MLKNNKNVNIEICPVCGCKAEEITETSSICRRCDIVISIDEVCPDCGSALYEDNDPGNDISMGVYCAHSHKTVSNQFLDREDFIEDDPDYVDCNKLHEKHVEVNKKYIKSYAAIDIVNNDYENAFNTIGKMKRLGYECNKEVECNNSNCAIYDVLSRKELKYELLNGDSVIVDTCDKFQDYYFIELL